MEINKLNEMHTINSATYANGYNPFIPWSKSIGYRPNSLKYADRFNHQSLAEDFLINSYTTRCDIENHGSLEMYASDSELMMLSMMEKRDRHGVLKIELPDSIPLDISVGEAMIRRRTVGTYTGDATTLPHLATILRVAAGISAQAMVRSTTGNEVSVNLRTVASGGGLYPISLYVIALDVKNLPRGVYEYLTNDDALYQYKNAESIDGILKTFAISDEYISLSRANFICLLVAQPWKSLRKYGNKGLRFVLQELGAITQNMHLASVALGLGSTDCGAYYENELNQLLHFDGVNKTILHTWVCGMAG